MNYTGAGIVVAVVDEGLNTNHPELRENYVSVSKKLRFSLLSCFFTHVCEGLPKICFWIKYAVMDIVLRTKYSSYIHTMCLCPLKKRKEKEKIL